MRRHLPGFSTIANLGISNKLGLIVVVLALPIAALLFVQYQQRTDTQSQADAEADGLDYVSAIIPFLREVQVHRGLVQRVLSGDEFSRDNMVRTAAAADSALAVINELDARHGKDLQTTALVQFLNTEWPKVKDIKSSATEANDAHTYIIQQGVFPLLSTVAIVEACPGPRPRQPQRDRRPHRLAPTAYRSPLPISKLRHGCPDFATGPARHC